jgi:hypothetical protein
MLQAEQMRAQSDQAKLAQKTASDQGEQKIEEEKIQIQQSENATDNQTALTIAAMREAGGHGTGNLKDGTSLGRV